MDWIGQLDDAYQQLIGYSVRTTSEMGVGHGEWIKVVVNSLSGFGT